MKTTEEGDEMSILKVARMGHPILRQVATPLLQEQISDSSVQRLIDDMVQTLAEVDGAGLAAPQVHSSVRLVVLASEDQKEHMVLVNPELSFLTTERIRSYEGCLSLPHLRGLVDRVARVHVEAFNHEGERVAFDAEGFSAIVIQHEVDHLDGVLFIDRCNTRSLSYLEELQKHGSLDPSFEAAMEGESNESASANPGSGDSSGADGPESPDQEI